MSKTVEEKAKEYAGKKPSELRRGYIDYIIWACKHDSYLAGYTQAQTDLSTENAQLKEALRKSLVYIEGYASFIYNSPFGNVGVVENDINEIKQLLKIESK